MARVVFTPQLRRFIAVGEVDTRASTVRAALEDAFEAHPVVRGYVLDDQGRLRPDVVLFVDGRRCAPACLGDDLPPGATVHVLQALSGG